MFFRPIDWPNACRVLSTTVIAAIIALVAYLFIVAVVWGNERHLTVIDLDRRISQIEEDRRWEKFRSEHGEHVRVGAVLVDLKDSTAAVVVPGPKLVQLLPAYAREAIERHYAGEPFKLREHMLWIKR